MQFIWGEGKDKGQYYILEKVGDFYICFFGCVRNGERDKVCYRDCIHIKLRELVKKESVLYNQGAL